MYYSSSITYNTINLCTWVNDNCVPATPSQIAKYSYNQCFFNTLGTYTFSSNNIDDKGNFEGTCKSCYHYLISAFIALLALFMWEIILNTEYSYYIISIYTYDKSFLILYSSRFSKLIMFIFPCCYHSLSQLT